MKMFKLVLFFALIPTSILHAQVGIGTTTPNASLDIQSSDVTAPANTDGILIPKIDEFPAVDPTVDQDGMMVFATGAGTITRGFYYWSDGSSTWTTISSSGPVISKIDELDDGKSDNDGSEDGSSVFIGVAAGLNDDSTNNMNTGLGYQSLLNNTIGSWNVGIGYESLYSNSTGSGNVAQGNRSLYLNTSGNENTATGHFALSENLNGASNTATGFRALINNTNGNYNTAFGSSAGINNITGSNNIFIGYHSGSLTNTSQSIFIGKDSGYSEINNYRLYIENSNSTTPLIYGEFDNDLLRVNGDFEVEKTTDASITVKTPFGDKSSLKLFESGGSGDYGFEFQYDGDPDKLYLWSRTFAGNEGIRMTWLKNGRVGINDTSPTALLDIEASNSATPANTDGILIPRVDAFPSTNPTTSQNGMLVFLTTDSTFYFWRNSTTSWVSINTSGSQSINDLIDGNSDNDGSQNYSSTYLGLNSGHNDDSTDNKNVGIGNLSLYSNTNGEFNTATGYRTLYKNSEGDNNTANGNRALFNNTVGNDNVAVGSFSLYDNTIGKENVAVGNLSLSSNTNGEFNTATGHRALYKNTAGDNNTANGYRALFNNTIGKDNVAVGYESLYNNRGNYNTAIGKVSLYSNADGNGNVAIGDQALESNTNGDYNCTIGYQALMNNTSGSSNVSMGFHSLNNNSTGSSNVAIGQNALYSNTTFSSNTAIGSSASYSTNGFSNTTAIGAGSAISSPNQARIGNASVSIIGGHANWSNFSDKRLKTNIKEDIVGLDFITKLRPVSYNLDMDAIARFEKTPNSLRLKDAERLKAKEIQTGFIAQEVEAAANEVGFDFHGIVKPYDSNGTYALRYAEFVVPLVKGMQEQQEIIKTQQEEIETLKNEIKEIKALLLKD